MDKKTFVVIGSNCFSGSYFVNHALNNGFNVLGISRSDEPNEIFLPHKWSYLDKDKFGKNIDNYIFKKLNINTDLEKIIELILEVKPSYIINFAAQGMVAQSWDDPIDWYQTNVISQVALHDKLRRFDFLEKYVHVSTPEVYGDTSNEWIKETYNFAPSTPYAVSRAACDLHLMSFYKAYDFPVIFTRAANVYGPGQQLYRIIPRTMLGALTGKGMNLHGGGLSERSFNFIKDVVEGTIDLSLNAEPGSSWHISTREAFSIKSLVKKICDITNVDFDQIVNINEERLGKDLNYLLDSTKLRERFNWKEKYSLDQGLALTLNWLETNLDILKNLPWEYIHKL